MPDEKAPVLQNLSPGDGDTQVSVDTTITLEIVDQDAGGAIPDTWGGGGLWGTTEWVDATP